MLRKGIPSDFEALYEIYMDPSVNPYLSFEIMPPQEFKPIFDELTQENDLYIYEIERKIAATCIIKKLTRRCQHVALLGTLATHPHLHGKGIGTKFMQDIIRILKKEGFKRLELSFEADNLIGEKFYHKLGFKLEGTLKNWFKRAHDTRYVDEHIMALLLD